MFSLALPYIQWLKQTEIENVLSRTDIYPVSGINLKVQLFSKPITCFQWLEKAVVVENIFCKTDIYIYIYIYKNIKS